MDLVVNAEQRGDGPDLVLIHSLGADMHLSDGVMDAFAARFRVLRYDVRGHGATRSDYTTVTIDLMRDDLLALLDERGDCKTHVVGLSMGGMIAQAFAAAYPERVDRLVLADTAAARDEPMRAAWHARAATARRDGMEPLVKPTLDRWFPEPFRSSDAPVLERVRATIRAMDPEHYAAAGEALAALEVRERLGAIPRPHAGRCRRARRSLTAALRGADPRRDRRRAAPDLGGRRSRPARADPRAVCAATCNTLIILGLSKERQDRRVFVDVGGMTTLRAQRAVDDVVGDDVAEVVAVRTHEAQAAVERERLLVARDADARLIRDRR